MNAEQLKALAAWLEKQIADLEKRIDPELYNHAHFDIYAGHLRDALRGIKAWEKLENMGGENYKWQCEDHGRAAELVYGYGTGHDTAIEAIEGAKP